MDSRDAQAFANVASEHAGRIASREGREAAVEFITFIVVQLVGVTSLKLGPEAAEAILRKAETSASASERRVH